MITRWQNIQNTSGRLSTISIAARPTSVNAQQSRQFVATERLPFHFSAYIVLPSGKSLQSCDRIPMAPASQATAAACSDSTFAFFLPGSFFERRQYIMMKLVESVRTNPSREASVHRRDGRQHGNMLQKFVSVMNRLSQITKLPKHHLLQLIIPMNTTTFCSWDLLQGLARTAPIVYARLPSFYCNLIIHHSSSAHSLAFHLRQSPATSPPIGGNIGGTSIITRLGSGNSQSPRQHSSNFNSWHQI